MFRRIVKENKNIYQKSSNTQHKQLLILSIVLSIQQHGGRFVRRCKDGQSWKVISDGEAKHKTAQALRELDYYSRHSAKSLDSSQHSNCSESSPVHISPESSHSRSTSQTAIFNTPEKACDLPMVIPPEHLFLKQEDITSDDGLAEFLKYVFPPEESAHPDQSFIESIDHEDNNALFDLIPLESNECAFENNREFEDMCHGLASMLSAC
jgi:hypothetical protein